MPQFTMNLDAHDDAFSPQTLRLRYDGNSQGHVIHKLLFGRWDTELSVAIGYVPDDAPQFIRDMIDELKADAARVRTEYPNRLITESSWIIQHNNQTQDLLDQIEYHMDEHWRDRYSGQFSPRRTYPTFESPVCALDQ